MTNGRLVAPVGPESADPSVLASRRADRADYRRLPIRVPGVAEMGTRYEAWLFRAVLLSRSLVDGTCHLGVRHADSAGWVGM